MYIIIEIKLESFMAKHQFLMLNNLFSAITALIFALCFVGPVFSQELLEDGAAPSHFDGASDVSCLNGRNWPRDSAHYNSGPATSIPITIDHMFAIIDIGGVDHRLDPVGGTGMGVSPNGRYVAFQAHCEEVGENTYSVGWYVLDLLNDGGLPVFVGQGGDPLLFRANVGRRPNGAWQPVDPIWSPDSQWVAYLLADNGITQVWRSKADGSIQERVTSSHSSVEAFYWSSDGQQILFETDALPDRRAAHLGNVWRGGLWVDEPQFYPDTATYYPVPFEALGGMPDLWVQDLSSNTVRKASQSEYDDHFTRYPVTLNELFGRVDRRSSHVERPHSRNFTESFNRNWAAWIERSDGESKIFLENNNQVDSVRQCELTECSGHISGLYWSRSTDELVFGRRSGSGVRYWNIYAWDYAEDSIRLVHEEANRHLTGCESTGESLICFSHDAEHPKLLVEINFEDGSIRTIFDPNPWFESIEVGSAELVTWENDFGISTMGWLIKPANFDVNREYPLVIIQYNASECFGGGTGSEYPAQIFAAKDMVVLCMSTPHRVRADESGIGGDTYIIRQSVVSSWESIIADLSDLGFIDRSRVGLTGFSAGADNMTYGLPRTDAFSAAIMAWMPWAPDAYPLSRESNRRRLQGQELGALRGPDGDNWEVIALSLNADRISAPILVQVSDDEVTGSMFEYVALSEQGVPVDMYVFNDEYHSKWWPQNRYAAQERSLAWMRFWLQGEVDPGSMSEGQLERWQGLCEQQIARLAASNDPVLRERATNQPCNSVSLALQ